MAKKAYQVKTKRLFLKPMTDVEMERLSLEAADAKRREIYEKRRSISSEMGDDRYWYCVWGIYDKKTGKYVGDFSFLGPMDNYEVSFDLFIREECRSQGYGKEALRAMMDVALYGDHGIFFIKAETSPDNGAMLKILDEMGYGKLTDEGEIGPRFEYERPQHSLLSFGVAIGLCFSAALGSAFHSYGMGVGIGLSVGVALGLYLDSVERRKYNDMRANRI